ncbi:nucleotidyltransferase [Flavobacterium hydrophilum]|uniref:Nucleotidyltransferase n=1 Tax=Flavobacterium hydrophilum TaxID=2211445 RepID=A0A2V4C0Y7_9FLAO|nr:nucleotidyltransferase [Flavobacterium hydrophilum]PXY44532.1 nucleotidyltransferase [Flavobacterium hydrophilum]
MARTITDIQNGIYAKIAADPTLPNSISQSAAYRRYTFIISYAIWLLESLFDTHTQEVTNIIETKFPHRLSWYRNAALAFQYGFDLIRDTDKYDNTGFTDEEIEASKVIKYSAVTKSGGQLRIKIATETAGVLAPITPEVKNAFDFYIDEITDAGVNYLVINLLPDILLLNMQIYRDPLVLDANGMSILNANYPVQDAIKEYMKELPFNGELVLAHLVDKLQQVPGVNIPHIVNAESQAINIDTNEYEDAQPINVRTVPVSGYFTIPNFDNISYVV